jgi:hypothetical protein
MMHRIIRSKEKAKLQWLQISGKINEDSLNNIRREANRHFINKKIKYMKSRTKDLATHSKNKNIRSHV